MLLLGGLGALYFLTMRSHLRARHNEKNKIFSTIGNILNEDIQNENQFQNWVFKLSRETGDISPVYLKPKTYALTFGKDQAGVVSKIFNLFDNKYEISIKKNKSSTRKYMENHRDSDYPVW